MTTLKRLLAAHPKLLQDRLDSPGAAGDKVGGALEGFFGNRTCSGSWRRISGPAIGPTTNFALRAGRESYTACPDAYTQARLFWVEGKIALGFGHLERAEEAFLAVRTGFVAEGNGYDVAMVSLDLALVYARQGRGRELKKLAEETRSLFGTLEIHREALSALLLFGQAAREERLSAERIEDFIRYFRKARANPSLRFR